MPIEYLGDCNPHAQSKPSNSRDGIFGWSAPQAIQAQKNEHAERKVVEKVKPVCPELAKRMHISGVVKLEAVVRANGSVKSTKVLGGNPVLLDAASEAAQQWKYEAGNSETSEILLVVFDPQ